MQDFLDVKTQNTDSRKLMSTVFMQGFFSSFCCARIYFGNCPAPPPTKDNRLSLSIRSSSGILLPFVKFKFLGG